MQFIELKVGQFFTAKGKTGIFQKNRSGWANNANIMGAKQFEEEEFGQVTPCEMVNPKTLLNFGWQELNASQAHALAIRVKEHGVLRPIILDPKTKKIIDGKHRIVAALMAKRHLVPVIYVTYDRH